MSLLCGVKYKDDRPVNTINRIRNILSDLGIFTVEKWFDSSIRGIYSVRIEIVGIGIGTNGKGVTCEYALASAYAEFMERLQNLILINYTSPEILKYGGFCFTPDEKYMTLEEMENGDNGSVKVFVPDLFEKKDNEITAFFSRKLEEWFSGSSLREERFRVLEDYQFIEGEPSSFNVVPYYNVHDGVVYYIPFLFVRLAYGSNGMCAGNTPEEAIVQGISEIFERYVNLQIIKRRIVPPTIPDKYIKKYPALYNTIQQLQSIGGYKLIFKDCSLGKNLPVIGLIVIDSVNQKYFVKFGAHPDPEIAMERCLTELLQGRDIKLLNNVFMELRYYGREVEDPANLIGVLKNGKGYYPIDIFAENPTYEFSEFNDLRELNNQEMLHYLTKLVSELGYQMFIRDVSYLDFPSYHVLIPGLSEFRAVSTGLINYANQIWESASIFKNLGNATESELERIVNYLQNMSRYEPPVENIGQLSFNMPGSFPWLKMNKHLFLSRVYYKMKDYKAALDSMEKFIRLNPQIQGEPDYLHYKCERDYLEALTRGLKSTEIQRVLGLFYTEKIFKDVVSLFEDPEQIFKDFGVLNCWHCSDCSHSHDCLYETIKKIIFKLKDRYAVNDIDQSTIKKLF